MTSFRSCARTTSRQADTRATGATAGSGERKRLVETSLESRQTTVLFADVTGSTKLYEAAGDALAAEAIGRCLENLRLSAEATGGRVVKTMGDSVMALFSNPDAAASAAARMQVAIESLPAVGDIKLGVRIGFHAGPVIQRNNDI
ncbi:MAG TPA: adenylate/guanylate cyclase domain-containing protein, partial [Burkholderiales bacterium]|nr:adenylate/guanylate cyclase domain-containing protein [Burkholderiales bacterium]